MATEHGWYELIEKMYSTHSGLDINTLENSPYGNITLENLYLKTSHEMEDFVFR